MKGRWSAKRSQSNKKMTKGQEWASSVESREDQHMAEVHHQNPAWAP